MMKKLGSSTNAFDEELVAKLASHSRHEARRASSGPYARIEARFVDDRFVPRGRPQEAKKGENGEAGSRSESVYLCA